MYSSFRLYDFSIGILVVTISSTCFLILFWTIHKYSKVVTNEIKKLTKHTMDYLSAKDITEKEKVIQAIKDDEIFERTKEIINF